MAAGALTVLTCSTLHHACHLKPTLNPPSSRPPPPTPPALQSKLYRAVFGDPPAAREAKSFLRGLVLEIMAECRRTPEAKEHCAIGQILAAVEAEGVDFSDEELMDEVVMIVFASHDTTATSLMWSVGGWRAQGPGKGRLQGRGRLQERGAAAGNAAAAGKGRLKGKGPLHGRGRLKGRGRLQGRGRVRVRANMLAAGRRCTLNLLHNFWL